jgi:hypothetical protein
MNVLSQLFLTAVLFVALLFSTGCSDDNNDNSCTFAYDGTCDEGLFDLCSNGTDCSDCGDCPDGGSSGSCSNTCVTAYDGDCDDGRPGADYDICSYGTDCDDCDGGSGGGGYCADAGEYCVDADECCDGTCVSNTNLCHDYCYSGSDCVSGCCVPTDAGNGVCADPSYCASKATEADADSGLDTVDGPGTLTAVETCSAAE